MSCRREKNAGNCQTPRAEEEVAACANLAKPPHLPLPNREFWPLTPALRRQQVDST
jgi:hypothetical protein